jgi:16S rRNA (uracil1498-N3)-methyltransferase
LFQSLLPRDKFEFVLQKCTEVGVSRFVPVITQRALVRETAIKPEKLDRWQRIITEAAEQSHRGRIPDLLPPVSFEKAMQELSSFEKCLIACEIVKMPNGKQGESIRVALRIEDKNIPGTIAVLIGPEGGFTEDEVHHACSVGAVPVGLGPRILRTETAAIVAATLILYELGQMEG